MLGHRPRICRPAPAPAGSGRGCCTRAQPRPGGVVNMECGLAGPTPPSWGVTCPPLPPKSLLLQQQMQPRIHCKKDNGQGAVQPKRLEPGVANHCCPQISRMDKSESDEGGLSANPAQIMSSFLRIGPITAAMGLIHGLMTKVGSN